MKTPEIMRGALSERSQHLAESLESSILETVSEVATMIGGPGDTPPNVAGAIQTALFTAAAKFSGNWIREVVDTNDNKIALIDEQLAHMRVFMIDEALSNVEDVGQG